MQKKKYSFYEIITIIWFIYVLIGAISLIPTYLNIKFGLEMPYIVDYIIEPVSNVFTLTFVYSPYVCLLLCLFDPHEKPFNFKYVIINIIDSILCFFTIIIYPFPFGIFLYEDHRVIFYCLSLFFAFFPVVVENYMYNKLSNKNCFKVITRLLMIFIIIVIALILSSCNGLGDNFG